MTDLYKKITTYVWYEQKKIFLINHNIDKDNK